MSADKTGEITLSDIRKYLKESLGVKRFSFKRYAENVIKSKDGNYIPASNDKQEFNQEQVISAMMAGRDVISVMPTGGGKSICFELPAICAEGITIVVSPITALIDDQVDKFNKQYKKMINRDIVPRAAYSGMYDLYGKSLFKEIMTGALAKAETEKEVSYKILYVSPERLMQSKFRSCFMEAVREGLKVSRIVYDEVHCFSQWGWSFRPSYLSTIRWIKEYEAIVGERLPRAGFTATASVADIKRIEELLELRRTKLFLSIGLNPNVDVSILFSEKVIEEKGSRTGVSIKKCIIFCNKKKTANRIERDLAGWNEAFKCTTYHASMSKKSRIEADRRFRMDNKIKDAVNVLAASIAYGIGINNSDIDQVINYGLPRSLEEYIQMIGRAGRGKKKGSAILIYKKQKVASASFIESVPRILKWKLELDERSPINELELEQQDLLIMLKIYRFCQFKEIIEQWLSEEDDKKKSDLLNKKVFEYFLFDVSDPQNAECIFASIEKLAHEIQEYCDAYIDSLDKKLSLDDEKKKSKIDYFEGVKKEAELAIRHTKDVIASTYAGGTDTNQAKKEIEKMYRALGKKVKAPLILKVNNTQIANIIRNNKKDSKNKDGVCLGKPYVITEHERYYSGAKPWYRDKDNHLKLVNANIKAPTGLLYIPDAKIRGDYSEIVSYVNKFYLEWKANNPEKQLEYIYGIEYVPDARRYTARRIRQKYKAYVVNLIFANSNGEWQLLLADEKHKVFEAECKLCGVSKTEIERLKKHIGADVNELEIIGTNKRFSEFTMERTYENKDPKLVVVRELSQWDVSFTITPIDESKILESERVISYWDMCVFDAICSLAFEGKKIIYLQAIWRLLSGDEKAILSGGYSDAGGSHGIKAKLEKSIEKLSNLHIAIEDPHISNKKIEGVFLPLRPNVTDGNKTFGYVLDIAEGMPALYQYAEQLNGELISIPAKKMNPELYSKEVLGIYGKAFYEDVSKWEEVTGLEISWDIDSISNKKDVAEETQNEKTSKKKYDSIERVCLSHYALSRSAISKRNKNQIMSFINADNLMEVLWDEICASNRRKGYVLPYIARVLEYDLAGYIQRGEVAILPYPR